MAESSVELLRVDGTDLDVVNAARVSFDKESTWEEDGLDKIIRRPDARLINFLARGCPEDELDDIVDNLWDSIFTYADEEAVREILREWRNTSTHWSPFAHVGLSFRIKAPIFVARQLGKHQVGLVWNEVSRRYVDSEPEFYDFQWRKRTDDKKQGSGGPYVDTGSLVHPDHEYEFVLHTAFEVYEGMLELGVCPEQARAVLPQSMMTTWRWTGSLLAFMRVIKDRMHPHAQQETREVAEMMAPHIECAFPVSYKALMSY